MALFRRRDAELERHLNKIIVPLDVREDVAKAEMLASTISIFKEAVSYGRKLGIDVDPLWLKTIYLQPLLPIMGSAGMLSPDGVMRIDATFGGINAYHLYHEIFHIAQFKSGLDGTQGGRFTVFLELGANMFSLAVLTKFDSNNYTAGKRKEMIGLLEEREGTIEKLKEKAGNISLILNSKIEDTHFIAHQLDAISCLLAYDMLANGINPLNVLTTTMSVEGVERLLQSENPKSAFGEPILNCENAKAAEIITLLRMR